jgi:hypothetical protein
MAVPSRSQGSSTRGCPRGCPRGRPRGCTATCRKPSAPKRLEVPSIIAPRSVEAWLADAGQDAPSREQKWRDSAHLALYGSGTVTPTWEAPERSSKAAGRDPRCAPTPIGWFKNGAERTRVTSVSSSAVTSPRAANQADSTKALRSKGGRSLAATHPAEMQSLDQPGASDRCHVVPCREPGPTSRCGALELPTPRSAVQTSDGCRSPSSSRKQGLTASPPDAEPLVLKQ